MFYEAQEAVQATLKGMVDERQESCQVIRSTEIGTELNTNLG